MKTEEEIKKYRDFLVTAGLDVTDVGESVIVILDWVLE